MALANYAHNGRNSFMISRSFAVKLDSVRPFAEKNTVRHFGRPKVGNLPVFRHVRLRPLQRFRLLVAFS